MHVPVLLREVLDLLAPRPGLTVVDATVGGGGHAEALLEATAPDGRLLAVDRDAAALAVARERLARFGARVRFAEGDYGDLSAHLRDAGLGPVGAVLADCGVSSLQLDDPSRGLSFRQDGPLDMRLSAAAPRTAADLVNSATQEELADLFFHFGEERASRRIARRIVERRARTPFTRTVDLAETVASAAHGRWGRLHPATRVFQALRIAVNGELESLEQLLRAAPECVAPGGRLAVISFHSLEDRRVKHAFREGDRAGVWSVLTRKPVTPSRAEQEENPRARSGKLRVAERMNPISRATLCRGRAPGR